MGLDAFSDELGRPIIEGTYQQEFVASLVFEAALALEDYDGTPNPRAVDARMHAYEAVKDYDCNKAQRALWYVGWAGGADYIRGILESSEPPGKPCMPQGLDIPPGEVQCPHKRIAWCGAGDTQIRVTDESPPPEEVWPLCFGSVRTKNGWMRFVYQR